MKPMRTSRLIGCAPFRGAKKRPQYYAGGGKIATGDNRGDAPLEVVVRPLLVRVLLLILALSAVLLAMSLAMQLGGGAPGPSSQ
jgi:hypothetical protein